MTNLYLLTWIFFGLALGHSTNDEEKRSLDERNSPPQHHLVTLRHRHFFNYDLERSWFELKDTIEVFGSTSTLNITPSSFKLRGERMSIESSSRDHWQTVAPSAEHVLAIPNLPVKPNTSDKETVVNLAKMTSDAYIFDPGAPDWLNTTLGFNFTRRFGWTDDGLRGHVFATDDNSTVVVAFKGTTVNYGGKLSSRDRINDNRLFSCCCGSQSHSFYPNVCNCSTGYYECNSDCLTSSILRNDSYYDAALDIVGRVMTDFPDSVLWLVGHSLGGGLASLVGLTLNIPSVTFEAPPERLPAQRIGLLPMTTATTSGRTMAYHFGNTADPIYMGACNGFFSSCTLWGFNFESQCHSGKMCIYDTVKDKGWRQNVLNHRINYVIENVLEAYDDVPQCIEDTECEDCFNWKFS